MRILFALLLFLGLGGVANAQTTCSSTLTQAQVLSSFADNSTQGITARNLRDYVCSNSAGSIPFTGATSFSQITINTPQPDAHAPLLVKVSPTAPNATGLYIESRTTSDSSAVGIVTRELYQASTGSNGASWDVQSWSQRTGAVVQSAEIQPGFCDTANEYAAIDFNINNRGGAGGINQTIGVTACPSGTPSFTPSQNDTWNLGGLTNEYLNVYSKSIVAGAGGIQSASQVSIQYPAAALVVNDTVGSTGPSVNLGVTGTTEFAFGTTGAGNFFLFDTSACATSVIQANRNGTMTLQPCGVISLTPATNHGVAVGTATDLGSGSLFVQKAIEALHITGNGASVPVANACTGFSAATGSTDLAGKFTFNSNTSCIIQFGTNFTNAPFCQVSVGSNAGGVQVTTTTSLLNMTFGVNTTAASYICMGT